MKCFGKTVLLAALMTAGIAGTSAYANTVYEFTLTPTSGTISGTVLLTLDAPIPTTPNGSFSVNPNDTDSANTAKVLSLLVTMSDGATYNLAQGGGSADADFHNNSAGTILFDGLDYSEAGVLPSLNLGGMTYNFSSNGNSAPPGGASGNIIFDGLAPAAATPEPSSLILLGTGLLGVGGFARRKFGI
jgi:hypothetical protein